MQTREHIRSNLYDLLAPLPITDRAGFVEQLANDPLFVPEPEQLDALAKELAGIAAQRFMQFVSLLLLHLGQKLIEQLAEVLQAIQAQVQQWISGLENLALQLLQALAELRELIEQLAAEVADAFGDAIERLEALIGSLSTGSGRTALRSDLSEEAYDFIKPLLTENLIYAVLPSDARRLARSTLRNAIDGTLDNAVADLIWEAFGAVAAEVDDLIDRLREIDAGANLTSEISDVLVDWFVDRVIGRSALRPPFPSASISHGTQTYWWLTGTASVPYGSASSRKSTSARFGWIWPGSSQR